MKNLIVVLFFALIAASVLIVVAELPAFYQCDGEECE
jgi:hypothetical protein